MKKTFAILAGVLLLLVLAGCGPKGGTVTLVNESSYTLSTIYLSMGQHTADNLYPGQWIRSKYDKNRHSFSIKFNLPNGDTKVVVEGLDGQWGQLKLTWWSTLFTLVNGEDKIVTVRDKPPEPLITP